MKKEKIYFINSTLQNIINKSRLIIFDVNGLIIDDEPIQLDAVNLALSNYGYKIKIDRSYWINHCVGHRADFYFEELLENNIDKKPHSIHKSIKEIIPDLIEKKNKYYMEILKSKFFNIVRPGFLDFIKYLSYRKKSSTIFLAIATSAVKDEANSIIGPNGLAIASYFDYIITGSDITNSKPHPEIYNKIIKISGINPGESLVFEDSETGVEAAYRAGLSIIAVPNDFTKSQNFEKANYVISDLTRSSEIISIQK